MERYSKATQAFFKDLSPDQEITNYHSQLRGLAEDDSPQYELKKNAVGFAEDINVLTLKDALVDLYGSDWIEWAPETVRKTVLDGQENEIIENKIQALVACLRTDTPWLEWHIFENVGKAFNHQVPNFGILQPLSVGECEVTMYNMGKLREDEDFDYEVLVYVAARAADENYVYLPEAMKIGACQEHLDSFVYDRWLKDKTRDSWEKIKGKDLRQVETSETPLGVQLGKLIVLREYVKESTEE